MTAWAARVAEHPRLQALDGAYRRWAHNTAPHPQQIVSARPAHPDPHVQPHADPAGRAGVRVLLGQHPRTALHRHATTNRRPGCCCPRRPATARERSADWSRSASARYLKRLLDEAFEDALRCSSDPLCAEHVPNDPSAELHAAACHACLFASETSCETNNRWLDRAVLAELTGDGLAFAL